MLAAADALRWPSFHLLGHSLGAGIASLIAAARPQRVQSLLLIELIGPNTMANEQSLAQLQRALTQRKELEDKPLRVFAQPEQAIRARQKAGDISHQAAETLDARVETGVRRMVVVVRSALDASRAAALCRSTDPGNLARHPRAEPVDPSRADGAADSRGDDSLART